MNDLSAGDRFLGVPLSSRLRYKCVIEVTAPVECYGSHGAAWEVHRENALPHALGALRTAAEAQTFIERSFYNGRTPSARGVLAIPVRAVAWIDS